MKTIIAMDTNYFLRVLVADCVRVMRSAGAEPKALGKSSASKEALENLPHSTSADAKWMNRIVEYLSEIDLARAFEKE
jgi:hypothetical protein